MLKWFGFCPTILADTSDAILLITFAPCYSQVEIAGQ